MTQNDKSSDWVSLDSVVLIESTYRFFTVLLTIKLITADTFYSLGANQFISKLISKLINKKYPFAVL